VRQAHCTPNASCSAQAEPLEDTRTLRDCCEWIKRLLSFMPDGRYELKSFATDEERRNVCAYGVFHVTHAGPGGPSPIPAKAPRPTTSMACSSKATASVV
jgi:hypothetical protein